MKIKVLFFAQLREAFGTGETLIEVNEGSSVGEAVESIFNASSLSHLKGLPLLYSVNEDFAEADQTLRAEDALALLPPVAGG